MSRVWLVPLLAVSWLLFTGEYVPAQEEPAGQQPAAQPADQPAEATPAAAATPTPAATADNGSPPPLREQTIYIPYSRLRSIFERDGRGVFIPYNQFQELWKAARSAARTIEEYKPPIGALLVEIDSRATVGRDVMNVEARLSIEVLTAGWHQIPLRLKESAIRSAKIGDAPARIVFSPETGYSVLLHKEGKQPEQIELKLEYSQAFEKSPGSNRVQFDAPQAPVNRWQITIGEAGVKVNVHPNVSASESVPEMAPPAAPGEEPPAEAPAAKPETVVEAFVGAADLVRIDWTAKAEGAAGLTPLATVQARQEVLIDEGVIRTRANLTYEITRADATELVIEVPEDHSVVNVFDPNVQKWEKKAEGDVQTISLTLFQPTRGTQNIAIELEKIAADKEMPQDMMNGELKLPMIRATQIGTAEELVAIGRQQGVVAVRLGSSLRGEVSARTGLLQIDQAELPAPLAGQTWSFAYRYAALPFDLAITVEKVQPLVEVEELVETYLEPNQITTSLLAILNIQRAGVFQVAVDVPEGYDIRTVQGRAAAGANAAAVDSHFVEEVVVDPANPAVKAKTKLVVNFTRQAIGPIGLWVELVRRQDDPNLLLPTGTASVLKLPMPRISPAGIARTNGRMIVYSPESLRITPSELLGLRAVSVEEALAGIESTRDGRFPTLTPLAGYMFTKEPASLTVEAQRRNPFIEVRQLLGVNVESGVVKYDAWFYYDIRYSGVKNLRIDLPASLAGSVRNQTPSLREQQLPAEPPLVPPVPGGYVAWQIAGQSELIGSHVLHLSWEKPLGELPVGKGVAIEVPQLRPAGVDRAWGQVTASKSETIEISVDGELAGLRSIDPQRDLMSGAEVRGAARAFEFQTDAWSLALLATRYELEEVKRTSIERGFVRMVVTRGDQVAVQALYRLRSAQQRVPIKLPGVDPTNSKANLDAQPLRINNQSALLEKDQTQFYIPLTGHSPDEEVLVEIRYSVTGSAASLSVPEFSELPEPPAVQQVYLAVYLPAEHALVGVRGDWTDEQAAPFIDQITDTIPPDDAAILNQLRRGIADCETAGDLFPTDGQRHLFSALRPAPAPAGNLRLTTIDRKMLHIGLFLLIAVLGVALTPQPVGTRLWWLAGVVVLLVLAAVFAPALARALLSDALWWALALVLLAWLVRFAVWAIPLALAGLGRFWQALVDWLRRPPPLVVPGGTIVAASSSSPFAAGTSPPQRTPPPSASDEQGGPSHG
jgi:hypothetical protein